MTTDCWYAKRAKVAMTFEDPVPVKAYSSSLNDVEIKPSRPGSTQLCSSRAIVISQVPRCHLFERSSPRLDNRKDRRRLLMDIARYDDLLAWKCSYLVV